MRDHAESPGPKLWVKIRVALIAAAFASGALIAAPAFGADRDPARDAVTNLEAYAFYKAGNYEKAREIWEGLAEHGNTTALINLANLFQQGQGVTEDQKRSMEYVTRAAELGDARAQFELGIAYEKGSVVGRDIAKAAAWLKRAADQGYADGQFAYGVMLATAHGQGLDKASDAERAEALSWLEKAKTGGNLEADDYIKVLAQTPG